MTVLEQIVQSPRLPDYVRELKSIMDAERERRQRFFDELRENQKAEFINGEVIVQSPVTLEHDEVSTRLVKLLSTYVDEHSLGHVSHEKLLISLTRNDYEPDICYFALPKSRKFKTGQMKFPAPDLVVEVISHSTEKIDRTIKFEDYAAHDVDEYWIVDPRKRTIEQYLLAGGKYELSVKLKDGIIRSRAIKGLALPARAAFDTQENLKALRAILARKG